MDFQQQIDEAMRRSLLAGPVPHPQPHIQPQHAQVPAAEERFRQRERIDGITADAFGWLRGGHVRASLQAEFNVSIMMPVDDGLQPHGNWADIVCSDGHSEDAMQIAVANISNLLRDRDQRAAWAATKRKNLIHVFVDDSNAALCARAPRGMVLDTCALIRVVEQGRWHGGSEAEAEAEAGGGAATAAPPPRDCARFAVGSGDQHASRWAAYRAGGYHTTVHQRRRSEGEQGVDAELHSLALKAIALGHYRDARTLVLVTGDGNDNDGKTTFPEVAIAALRQGWAVEVWSWEAGCSGRWRDLQQTYGPTGKFALRLLDEHRGELVVRAERSSQERMAVAAGAAGGGGGGVGGGGGGYAGASSHGHGAGRVSASDQDRNWRSRSPPRDRSRSPPRDPSRSPPRGHHHAPRQQQHGQRQLPRGAKPCTRFASNGHCPGGPRWGPDGPPMGSSGRDSHAAMQPVRGAAAYAPRPPPWAQPQPRAQPQPQPRQEPLPRAQQPCRFFRRSGYVYCAFGDGCPYSHVRGG